MTKIIIKIVWDLICDIPNNILQFLFDAYAEKEDKRIKERNKAKKGLG